MNRIIKCIVAIALSLIGHVSLSQNIPNGSTLQWLPTPALPNLPIPYNYGANAGVSLADQTTPKLNYARTWLPQVPVNSFTGFELNGSDNYLVKTTYTNGWGESLQENTRGTGTTGKDIIQVYDRRVSMTATGFLPFAAQKQTKFVYSPYLDQRNYYNTVHPDEAGTSYSKRLKPQNQSTPEIHEYSPGKSYVGQSIGTTTKKTFNDANEVWKIQFSNNVVFKDGYYGANELVVKTTYGQHDGIVKEYFNKNGQLVCKKVKDGVDNNASSWATTCYAYNDLGQLMLIAPPKVMTSLFTSLPLSRCYWFQYNKYGSITEKYSPGMKINRKEVFVYDRKQRVVLHQTPQMFEDQQYEFNIYDNRGRVNTSGTLTSNVSYTDWQSNIDNTQNPTPGTLLSYFINEQSGPIIGLIPGCVILTYNFYDGRYSGSGFSNGNTFNTSYAQHYRSDLGAETPVWYKNSHGLLTFSAVKIIDAGNNNLGSNIYTVTQYYYDRKGKLIQTRTAIPWYVGTLATNITTYQYDFSGNLILEIEDHRGPNYNVPGSTKPLTLRQTAYYYDYANGGRLINVKEKMDNSAWRSIASYTYDELGKVSKKNLGGIENQNYKYNLKGQLTAINGNYTEYGQGSSDAPTTFGCKLSYDYGFAIPRLDGKLSGVVWRGAGSAPKHSYGYEYDQSGRLKHAEFREFSHSTYIAMYNSNGPIYNTGLNWNKQFKDYTASNITYDKDGNLLTMNQVGVPLGFNHPTYIDVLKYFYSNGILTSVIDGVAWDPDLDDFTNDNCDPDYSPEQNDPPVVSSKGVGIGQEYQYYDLGDPPLTPNSDECGDYTYDANGNLTHDGNKGIDITYNFLNLPVDVTKVNNTGNNLNAPSTIHNVYDGNGVLLQKTIVDNSQQLQDVDVYEYVGSFVYRNDSLIYALHDEGRTRYVADPGEFKYDYFVKDHLGNVRTAITADPYNGLDYVASHELASANLEASIFAHINEVRSGNPLPSTNNTMAARLNGSVDSTRIGTALLLEVMPGDQIDLSAQYYWENDTSGGVYSSDTSMMSALLSTLTGGVGGYVGNEAPSATLLNGLLNTSNYIDVYSQLIGSQTNASLPRAYLNYQVFDANMNLIPAQSGAIQIGSVQSAWAQMDLNTPMTIGVNGYVLVDVSNASHTDVNFDQLHVTFYRGNVIQEQHYYPYGLCVKHGEGPEEKNKFKYEGKLMQDELDLQLYDFHARQYDPQIGRFWGLDPADQFPSGYSGMAGDPANVVDPTGMVSKEGNFAGTSSGGGYSGTSSGEDFWSGLSALIDAGFVGDIDEFMARKRLGRQFYRNDLGAAGGGSADDPTDVYSQNGQFLAKVDDGLTNVFILNFTANKDMFFMYFNMLMTEKIDFKDPSIQAIGKLYDIDAFSKFFDDYANKYPAQSINGSSLDGASNITVKNLETNEKVPTKLYSEVIANTVFKNGILTVGSATPATKNDYQYVEPQALASESNSKTTIHLHQLSVPSQLYFTINGITGAGSGEFELMSPSKPDRMYHQSQQFSGFRSIMVNPKRIYLYNANPKHDIVIDRK